jgi:hypothetical protein
MAHYNTIRCLNSEAVNNRHNEMNGVSATAKYARLESTLPVLNDRLTGMMHIVVDIL